MMVRPKCIVAVKEAVVAVAEVDKEIRVVVALHSK